MALALTSCVRSEDITITGVSNYELRLPSAVNLAVGVENRSAHRLHLLSCNVDAAYRGRKVMTAVLHEPVTVEKRFAGDVPVGLRLKVSDPLAGLAVMGDLQRSLPGITLTGEVVVKAGCMKRKIHLENEPLSQFLATFGLSL